MALKGVDKARTDLRINASDTAKHAAPSRGDRKLKNKIRTLCISKLGGEDEGNLEDLTRSNPGPLIVMKVRTLI